MHRVVCNSWWEKNKAQNHNLYCKISNSVVAMNKSILCFMLCELLLWKCMGYFGRKGGSKEEKKGKEGKHKIEEWEERNWGAEFHPLTIGTLPSASGVSGYMFPYCSVKPWRLDTFFKKRPKQRESRSGCQVCWKTKLILMWEFRVVWAVLAWHEY